MDPKLHLGERLRTWGLQSAHRLVVLTLVTSWLPLPLVLYATSWSLTYALLVAAALAVLLVFGLEFPAPVRARRLTRAQWVAAFRGLLGGTCDDDPAVAREILTQLDRRRARYDRRSTGGFRALMVFGSACMAFLGVRAIHYHRPGPAAAAFAVVAFDMMVAVTVHRRREKSMEKAEAAGLAASDVLAKVGSGV